MTGILKNKAHSTLVFFFLLLISNWATGQIKTIFHTQNIPVQIDQKNYFPSSFKDSIDLEKFLKKTNLEFIKEGFITFSVDSIKGTKLKKNIYIDFGNKYSWTTLSPGNVDEEILSKIGYRNKVYNNKSFSHLQLSKLYSTLLEQLENNGYPFARIKLDSVTISNNSIHGVLNLRKNNKIIIDTIQIKGDLKISPNYLSNYLNIKKGDLYNESAFSSITTRIKELPFASEKFPPEVWFSEKTAKVIVVLEKKKANVFNGIIGLQPNDETDEVNLTGEVNLKLTNPIGGGEVFQFEWRRLQDQTQSILLSANIPFVFKTPLGFDANLKILRQDTSFNTVRQQLSIPYYLKKGNFFKVFIENTTSNLIGNSEQQPDFADYTYLGYGIGFRGNFVDYKLNPRKGWTIQTNVSLGEKEFGKDLHNNEAFTDIPLTSSMVKAETKLSLYIPILKSSTLKFAINNGLIQNEQLATNELFRIGGLKTLRGFDEASIFSSNYTIATIEYRLLLETNSYLSAFTDLAYYEKNTFVESISDTPYGFGVGVTFETKAGIFTLNYALGKQFNTPAQLKNGKVHFGIINYF